MCDLTQFFVVVPMLGMNACILVKYFMHEVLLKFRIFRLFVMDDGSPFKGVFTVAYDSLYLK